MKAQFILELLEDGDLKLLKELAEKEVLEQFEKQKGNAKLLSAVRKMMKNKALPEYSVGYSLVNDKYYFTDGYRLLESPSNLGFGALAKPLNVEGVTPRFEGKIAEVDILELQMVIRENKEIIKRNKQIKKEYKGTVEIKKPYLQLKQFIINNEIAFNPVYMMEMIEATGTNIIHYENPLCACYFGDNHRNLLLPVRIK